MRCRFALALSCSCLLGGVTPVAQEIPADEFIWDSGPYTPESLATIRAETNLIEVPVVVRDRSDRPVDNLQKRDFLLFDNGKPQTISTFQVFLGQASAGAAPLVAGGPPSKAAATPVVQPRFVALFFDDVNTSFANLHLYNDATANLDYGRDQAIRYLRNGLDRGEQVGVFTASGSLTVNFTDNVNALLAALAKLRLYPRMADQAPGACPLLQTYQAWAILHLPPHTEEWNAAYTQSLRCWGRMLAESKMMMEAEIKQGSAEPWARNTLASISSVVSRLGEMPGRRILILASGGFETLSFRREQQRIVQAANRAKVVINSLSTVGLAPWSPPSASKYDPSGLMDPLNDSLATLAYGTGGQFFHNNNDLSHGFQELSTPPTAYLLGFSPENLRSDGSLHNLKVKVVEGEHLSIQARPNYYAPGGEQTPAEKKATRLDQIVMASDALAEIPVEITIAAGAGGRLKISVHVDAGKLPFRRVAGRHMERLIFVTALFDPSDQFLNAVEGVMQLQLKETTLEQLSVHGFDTQITIQAPAGRYRLRQVVQEIEGGRMAAANRPLELH